MDEVKFTFYAVMANGHDFTFVNTAKEALEEISMRIGVCDDESFSIEPVRGIYELVRRCGAFEDYSDDWMTDVLELALGMVNQKKNQQAKEEVIPCTKEEKQDESGEGKDEC